MKRVAKNECVESKKFLKKHKFGHFIFKIIIIFCYIYYLLVMINTIMKSYEKECQRRRKD